MKKKLHLHRETLYRVDAQDARQVVGGAGTAVTCPHTTLCTRAGTCSENPTCPPSICVVC